MESTVRKILESINILAPLEFHTDEPRDYILKKFIQEEIGYASFKGVQKSMFLKNVLFLKNVKWRDQFWNSAVIGN